MDNTRILSGPEFENAVTRSREETIKTKQEEEKRSVRAIAQFMASEQRETKTWINT